MGDDTLWKLKRYMNDPLKWRLYDTCGVHHVSTERGHDIFMLVEKDYPLTRALMTVMLVNKLQVDESSEMANELLRKIFYQHLVSLATSGMLQINSEDMETSTESRFKNVKERTKLINAKDELRST
ncbi:hypothetical protein Tco_1415041 [Tanacetum coccineum]